MESPGDNNNFLQDRISGAKPSLTTNNRRNEPGEETYGYNFYDTQNMHHLNEGVHIINQPLINQFQEQGLVGILGEEFDNDSYSEDEGIDDYKKGGYHPVFRGEVLNGRYVILQKLGWGHFSTVWLSRDVKYNTYVAIKIQKNASHYLEAAFDEVEILQRAVKETQNPEWIKDIKEIYGRKGNEVDVDDCHVVQLLNGFIYQGPYGKHFCMVFEILGVNLLEIIKRYEYKGIPLSICKEISKQVLVGLHYLHKYCKIIHTDLKPENVMVCLNQKELEEIIGSGQLNNSKKVQKRLATIKNRIRKLKGLPPVEHSEHSDDNEHKESDETTEIKKKESHSEATTEEMTPQNLKNLLKTGKICTEADLEREYEKLISSKQITNKKEKKKLKKKLKKRLKTNQVVEADTNGENNGTHKILKSTKMEIVTNNSIDQRPRLKFAMNPDFYRSGLTENFRIKIADLGNGCWVHHHFQPEIQTRQYRSPETILGIKYNDRADIWSFACMLFEMLTGEFLFDPRKNERYSKSTDHLLLMMQMLNKFQKSYSTIGTQSKKFFDGNGNFKKLNFSGYKSMEEVLIKKYNVKPEEAREIQDFLLPMLEIVPEKRISAREALEHPWLEVKEGESFFKAIDQNETASFDETKKKKEFGLLYKPIVEEEDFDADKSRASIQTDDELEDDNFALTKYDREVKFFDRNYKNVYVGYADGIDLNHLDNTENSQFWQK